MKNVDYDEAARLAKQFGEGKRPVRKKTLEQKKEAVLIDMIVKETKEKILKDAEKMFRDADEAPVKDGQWLFKFRGWFFVENKTYLKLDEQAVPDKLKRYPEMAVTIFVVPKSVHIVPIILKGRKNIVFIEEGSGANIASYIIIKTGVSIPVSEFGGELENY